MRVLIDDARTRPGRAYLFEKPQAIIRADREEQVSTSLAELQRAVDSGAHVAGFFSYELGYAIEPRLAKLMPGERSVPLLWFGVFPDKRTLSGDEITGYLDARAPGEYRVGQPVLTLDEGGYCERFERVKRYITAGDIYQLNLTLKGRFDFCGDPLALYRDLRRKQPVSHGAVIETDGFTVVSSSPELFLDIDRKRVVTRPMKGTAPRALTLNADRETARWLSSDIKSRAENLMIVDLMRNDIGRVARTGSVRVTDLFTVETYETLHQMTSGVEAQLKDGTGIAELVNGLFPPGSVTGAPKVRAMEIIRELETEPRGVYTGAIGSISPDGTASFNVAIRTLTLFDGGKGEIGIGSGVVHDSRAKAEYDECILKMRFLTEPVREFQLIETMLFDAEDGGYALLERHMDRLEASALYFLFPCPRKDIVAALGSRAKNYADGPYRVRLLLFRDGHFEIGETSIGGAAMADMSYVISDKRIDSRDVFLFHKTTQRQLYDSEWTHMHDAAGSDEVVFLNERGEVCEGSRTNVFIRKGGKLLTPPLSCGLLPGTLREDLIGQDMAEEAMIMPEDLETADAVYLGNSVRGLVPARLLTRQEAHAAS